jgi:hypothetical protein
MIANSNAAVLALIPYEMQLKMRHLGTAVAGILAICGNLDDFAQHSRERIFAVALVPASLPTHEWWSLWELLSTMEPLKLSKASSASAAAQPATEQSGQNRSIAFSGKSLVIG